MKDFIVSNYVLILSIVLISIITLIGYFVDRTRSNKKEPVIRKETTPVMNNNMLNNNINNTNNNINTSFDINQSINNINNNFNNNQNG